MTPSLTPRFFVNGCNGHVLALRKSIKLLYDYQFQVLPYVYTHTIGVATTMFLIANAIMKGTNVGQI